jgi:hypothetical protein
MPKTKSATKKQFTSKSQLRTCYSKKYAAEKKGQKFTWNCDEFLKNTKNPQSLPEKVCIEKIISDKRLMVKRETKTEEKRRKYYPKKI